MHPIHFAALLASLVPAGAPRASGDAGLPVDTSSIDMGWTDTTWIDIGSPAIDGSVFAPHRARVRVQVDGVTVAEWVNELTLGDSAGRSIARWVTTGARLNADGSVDGRWQLRQTFDRVTLAPIAYERSNEGEVVARFTVEGKRVRGSRRMRADGPHEPMDLAIDRPGFIASASDLVPLAAGKLLSAGSVMAAPFWGPNMTASELRVFTVVRREPIDVEGTAWNAWRVEERDHATGRLGATWFLVEDSPYMVAGEVYMPDGRVRKMTEVAVP